MMLREQSRRATQLLLIGLTATAFTGAASAAINYEFEGSSEGGIAKATMSFADTLVGDINENKFLTVFIDNLSPTSLQDGDGPNSPGISAWSFGFEDETKLHDWRLEALTSDKDSLVIIGTSYDDESCDGGCLWGDTGGGKNGGGGGFGTIGPNEQYTFEYMYGTSNGKGLLYNPDVVDGLDIESSPYYFTTAVLTLEFDSSTSSAVPASTALRMMNVGKDGEGSITMNGDRCTEGDDCDNGGGGNGGEVPEPTGLALVALGIAGLGATRRRKMRR